jgi:hypothetical protein
VTAEARNFFARVLIILLTLNLKKGWHPDTPGTNALMLSKFGIKVWAPRPLI